MSYSTAKDFWEGLSDYPSYPNTKERRLIDLNFIVSNITFEESVIDLGCGDGYLLVALREFTNFNKFYGYDISPELLKKLIDRWGNESYLLTQVCDFTKITKFPKTDLIVSMGMFPYIFDIKDVKRIMSAMAADLLIVRVPCTGKNEDEYINKYSEDLDANYSSIYRTKDNYLEIFNAFYNEVVMSRAYPDEIESNYGTKHYFFVCKCKK